MRAIFVLFFVCLPLWSHVRADIIELKLDTGGNANGVGTISGSTFTLDTVLLTVDGVDFTARLEVVGNGSDVDNNTNGLGVDGTTVNEGESLSFSVSILTQSGGTVNFDGFTNLDFNSFTTTGDDEATVNGNTISGDIDQFDLTMAPYNTPTSLVVAGEAGSPGAPNTSFQLDDVSAQFTGSPTAIPEPSSFAIVGLSLGSIVFVRRRRSRAKSSTKGQAKLVRC